MATKIKVLKFDKKKPIDLNDCPEAGCEVIEVGKNKFTMRDYRPQEGHDDSLPYVGILCCNGKPLCKCFNDGWGGETEMTPVGVAEGAIMRSIANKISDFKWVYKSMVFDLKLDFIADVLAQTENHKLKNTIKGRI